MSKGSIEVITGPMFAGKTTELIRRIKRLKHRNRDCIVFKPKIDNRYSKTKIVSHDKEEFESIPVEKAIDIKKHLIDNPKIRHIAIDEAQFFSTNEKENLYDVLYKLKHDGYYIIINGLDMDHNGNPFGLMPNLMAIAEKVDKLTAVCMYPKCEEDASMSYHKTNKKKSINDIELGEKDIYEARCFKHWSKES